jgi:hypothetical protein
MFRSYIHIVLKEMSSISKYRNLIIHSRATDD